MKPVFYALGSVVLVTAGCGGKVVFDTKAGSGGADSTSVTPASNGVVTSSTVGDVVTTGSNTTSTSTTTTTASGAFTCGDPPSGLSDCAGSAVSSTGGAGDCIEHFFCAPDGSMLEEDCNDSGCSCLIDSVTACSCVVDQGGGICSGAAQPCCPFGG